MLLVNNDSDTWDELETVARAAGYDVTPVHHSAIGAIDPRGYDLAILSGGWWYDDEVKLLTEYAEELQFIKSTSIPILGICIGFQLMHVATDQAVPLLDAPEYGLLPIDVNIAGQMLFGFPETVNVFKNHTRGVFQTDPQFEVLASRNGHVEITLHKTKPLLGVQFHPEVGELEECVALIKTLVSGLIKVPVN